MEALILNFAIGLPGFLLAIVCHEAAHAYVANKFGDNTAKAAGRLTLNPVAHLDVMGSLLLPLIGAMVGGVMFGWARPVPVNSRNFKKPRMASFWVSFAGPGMNLILGVLSGLAFTLVVVKVPQTFTLYLPLIKILNSSVYVNFVLAVFNLIPFPPLDGSKMVSSLLSYNQARKYDELERYSFFFFMGLFILSYMGIHIFEFLLSPAIALAEWVKQYFFFLLS